MWFKFWGVRGSIPTPGAGTVRYGGNTSCIELRVGEQILILDAGSGLRLLGRQLLTEFNEQPLELTLLLTHTHWDHIQGLPFFLPMYKPQNRLRIFGSKGARHGLASVLSGQMENPFFPIGLRQVPANISIEELQELSFKLGLVQVQATLAHHPGVCLGYRLTSAEGSVAFFPDNELPPPPTPAEPPAGQDPLVTFLRGTDALIMDAQYDATEYRQHVGWGHGCVDDVVALALAAQVKRLFLFHHDPEHDDARLEQMLARARQLVAQQKATLQVDLAQEGVRVELGR